MKVKALVPFKFSVEVEIEMKPLEQEFETKNRALAAAREQFIKEIGESKESISEMVSIMEPLFLKDVLIREEVI